MIEKVSILIASIALISSVGINAWTFKIMETRIQFLKEDIEKLKNSEGKWIVKYRRLVQLILKHRECTPGKECVIHKTYIDTIEDEGVI
jgi:hypothetical protein